MMKACAILLSYKRPQNMNIMLREIMAVPEISKVILSNNNPEVDIYQWVDESLQDRVEIISQPVHTLYTKRFEIAMEEKFSYFFCPDDDVFLSSSQISYLLNQLKKSPQVPHGFYGQVKTFMGGEVGLASGICGIDCEVDVLNRGYFFTNKHLFNLKKLLIKYGFDNINQAKFMEDVLMSFCGDSRPLCHDIGNIKDCPTSHNEEIATFKQDGFDQIRLNGYLKLCDLTQRV